MNTAATREEALSHLNDAIMWNIPASPERAFLIEDLTFLQDTLYGLDAEVEDLENEVTGLLQELEDKHIDLECEEGMRRLVELENERLREQLNLPF